MDLSKERKLGNNGDEFLRQLNNYQLFNGFAARSLSELSSSYWLV